MEAQLVCVNVLLFVFPHLHQADEADLHAVHEDLLQPALLCLAAVVERAVVLLHGGAVHLAQAGAPCGEGGQLWRGGGLVLQQEDYQGGQQGCNNCKVIGIGN